ncbi:hypothetical protein H2200_011886 [Cladophialophora chaetospira]|uniref:BTB domain-containing protein n=1 Tax=Cladophialophora chaetospira TaxID=386627 RepID=A0AA38WYY0_9EURO|nr:hypothetical protein H2200_011886 [Cladophialophora chaetospira]
MVSPKRPREDTYEVLPSNSKRLCFATDSSIIPIIVSPIKIKFLVHETILSRFKWFKACLKPGLKEHEEKKIDLPEEDPAAIAIIIEWMYAKIVRPDRNDIKELANGYIAADKYSMPELANAIMDQIRLSAYRTVDGQRIHIIAPPAWLQQIWPNTSEGSPLREYALDYLHYSMSVAPDLYRSEESLSARLLKTKMMEDGEIGLELLWYFADVGRAVQNPSKQVGCYYHVHEEGGRCK